MALSTQKMRGAAVSLGYINIPTIGTPVALSSVVDANNNNAPDKTYPPPPQFPGSQTESSPTFRSFHIQAYKPGANNNGMVANTGQIYLLQAAAAGGSGNRTDSGAMIAVIPPGTDYFFPPDGAGAMRFSPYYLYLDGDNNNDGALVAGYDVEP